MAARFLTKAAAASASAAKAVTRSRLPRVLHQRGNHSQPGSDFISRSELNAMKHELLNQMNESHHQNSLHYNTLKYRVDGLQEKLDAGLKYNQISLDNMNSKNTLYVMGLVTAVTSGLFSIARLYQLSQELFPEGFFPDPPKEEEP